MRHFCTLLTAALLGLLVNTAGAHADTITLGSTYSGNINMIVDGTASPGEGGGNIGGTTGVISGVTTSFLDAYCVDLFTSASLSTTYTATYNLTGTINGTSLAAAGQIAWLMLNIAPTISTQTQYQALQGLIWQLEGPTSGHTVTFNTAAGTNSAAAIADFNLYLGKLGTNVAAVSTIDWVNPVSSTGAYDGQGFAVVTSAQLAASVVEPASMTLLAFGCIALYPLRRRGTAPAEPV